MFGDPYFPFQKQILFTITSTLSKNEQKRRCGKLKKFKISVHGRSNPAIARRLKLRSPNANLLFKDDRAQKTSDVQIFVKLWLYVENDKIRLET